MFWLFLGVLGYVLPTFGVQAEARLRLAGLGFRVWGLLGFRVFCVCCALPCLAGNVQWVIVSFKQIDYGVYGDLFVIHPKP